MNRYTVANDWAQHHGITFHFAYSDLILGRIVRESATLIDRRTGHDYPDGGFRVRIECKDKTLAFKTKTFKGESAWNDSLLYYEDVYRAMDRLALQDIDA